jgi:hypothetical protein
MGDEEKDKLYKVMAMVVGLAVMLSTGLNTAINKLSPDARYDSWTASQDVEAMKQCRGETDRRFKRNESYIESIRTEVHQALTNDSINTERFNQLRDQYRRHLDKNH